MSSNTPIILSAKNITKSYLLDKNPITIFSDLSITVNKGDHIAIMGASGSGKSTLLSLLAVLDKPDTGKIVFNGQDITNFSEDQLAKLRRTEFGFVFQSFHLIPSLSAMENIMFPLELAGVKTAAAKKEALKMLKKVNLEHRANSFPYQLSGGEKQRTAIARALIHKPKILFADEPTGNLDEENSEQVFKLLLDLQKEFGTALVVITHEMNIAKKADKILVLEGGVIKPIKK